jgi:MFS transporter, AAHS family, 4-hydroxybenzoate transporter
MPTGTSWMTRIGRFGAISGELFMSLTIPIGIATIAAHLVGRRNTKVMPILMARQT